MRRNLHSSPLPLISLLILIPAGTLAGTVSGLHVFVNGEAADANEVNENFDIVEAAVNDNDTRFTAALSLANTAINAASDAEASAAAAQATADAAQQRVGGSCGVGSSIRAIAPDGSVTCEVDTDTNTQLTSAQVAAAAISKGFVTGPHTVDTTLDEAAVDAFVANNGYAIASVQGPHDRLGAANTALGADALANASDDLELGTSEHNTAIGAGALQSNAHGFSNTAVGALALHSSPNGSGSTAVGYGALRVTNDEGTWNTALGSQALYNNTAGAQNVALGYRPLLSNELGGQNLAAGYVALLSNTTGNENTAIGFSSMLNNTQGGGNVANGSRTLQRNVVGSFNTAVGTEALGFNVAGVHNIAVGSYAGSSTTGSHNILIGNDGASGESGIIRVGTQGTHIETHMVGSLHLDDDSPNYDVWVQGGASTSPGTARNLALLGRNDTDTLVINYGNEYSGGTRIESGLQVTGCINGAFCSDARLKAEVAPLGRRALDDLLQIEAATYQWKDSPEQGTQIGLIAQQVESVVPEVVATSSDGRQKGLSCTGLNAITIQAIQELKEQKDAEIAALRAEMEFRLARLERLDRSAEAIARK